MTYETKQMIVNKQVQSMCRRDGLSLCQVEIWHKNGKHSIEVYDPQTAQQIAFDIRFNGGKAEITQIERN